MSTIVSPFSFRIVFSILLRITATAWVRDWLCKLQKGCTRLAAASDQVYQLLSHCRWFALGTPASSTTKTGRHDIAESGVKHNQNQIKSNYGPWLPLLYLPFLSCNMCVQRYY
jgi:hypothetical protein